MAVMDSKELKRLLWRGSTIAGFRTLTIVLTIVVVVMLVLWQPWVMKVTGSGRTISVTGASTITAIPDQYVFSPSYDFNNSNQKAALSALAAKSDQIVAKLKSLGVASKDIKTNASGYADYGYYIPVYTGGSTYTLNLTVTINVPKLAQKVQDYLVATSPAGQITPTVSFSTAKQHELQNQARAKAEQDARSQADQSAKTLGFSVGAVKTVTDSNNSVFPMAYGSAVSSGALDMAVPKSLTLQPGQNDLTYSVTVVYYIQ